MVVLSDDLGIVVVIDWFCVLVSDMWFVIFGFVDLVDVCIYDVVVDGLVLFLVEYDG